VRAVLCRDVSVASGAISRPRAQTAVSLEIGRRPFEVIFDDIVSGSRAESRRRRGMPDDDDFSAIETINPLALVRGNDCDPILDAGLLELDPDRTDLSTSKTKRSSRAGRRTYTPRDFERSRPGRESQR
jgi:hypothetical protein